VLVKQAIFLVQTMKFCVCHTTSQYRTVVFAIFWSAGPRQRVECLVPRIQATALRVESRFCNLSISSLVLLTTELCHRCLTYCLFNHSKGRDIPLNALPKDTSKLTAFSPHHPFNSERQAGKL